MWPGQFIGLSANSRSSDEVVNMFSRYLAQWPERSHSDFGMIAGVRTST